jgi:hypothetical protein
MTHAEQQAAIRLQGTGLDPVKVVRLARMVAQRYPDRSVACLLAELPAKVIVAEDHDNGVSNGNQVWAMCVDGKVKTIMLRRSSQPATAKALRVDVVKVLVR